MYEFRVGRGLPATLARAARQMAGAGDPISTRQLKELRRVARDHGGLNDTSRMFLAGLLDAENTRVLARTPIRSGATIGFSLGSIRAGMPRVRALGRPRTPVRTNEAARAVAPELSNPPGERTLADHEFEFRIGREVPATLARAAKQHVGSGVPVSTADLRRLLRVARDGDGLGDTSRMFLAGLLDAENTRVLARTPIRPGEAVGFSLASIQGGMPEVRRTARDAAAVPDPGAPSARLSRAASTTKPPAGTTAPTADALARDIREVVTGYLFSNRNLVLAEMARFKTAPPGQSPAASPGAEQALDITELQKAAAVLAKLQVAQELARSAYVGYATSTNAVPPIGGAYPAPPVTVVVPVRFDPEAGPPQMTSQKNLGIFTPHGPDVDVKPYAQIKQLYDQASASIARLQTLQPALYAIGREGSSARTEAFATAGMLDAAAQLSAGLQSVFRDIEATQVKLDEGELNPLDLTPVAERLLLGHVASPTGVDWTTPAASVIGREALKGHDLHRALAALGLNVLTMVLFMLGPLGVVAGLGIMAGQAYVSTERHEGLAQASKTAVKPGTETVKRSTVEAAEEEKIADRVAIALAVLAVGVSAAAKALGPIRGPAGEPGLKPPSSETSGTQPLPVTGTSGTQPLPVTGTSGTRPPVASEPTSTLPSASKPVIKPVPAPEPVTEPQAGAPVAKPVVKPSATEAGAQPAATQGVSPFDASKQAAIAQELAELEQKSAALNEPIQRLTTEVSGLKGRAARLRTAANTARQEGVLTEEAWLLFNELEAGMSEGERAELARARNPRQPISVQKIVDRVLTKKAADLDAEARPSEQKLAKLQSEKRALDARAQELQYLGKFKLPERSGGSYKQVRNATNGGEVHHLVADTAYYGEIALTYDEGPGIWMTEADHAQTASHGYTNQALKFQADQRALVQQGKFMEALQMGIDDVRAKFPDGRYEPALKKALSYAKGIEAAKLKPK